MAQVNATLTIRTSKSLKEEVGKILSRLGLNHSTAVNMFYQQVLVGGFRGQANFLLFNQEPVIFRWRYKLDEISISL